MTREPSSLCPNIAPELVRELVSIGPGTVCSPGCGTLLRRASDHKWANEINAMTSPDLREPAARQTQHEPRITQNRRIGDMNPASTTQADRSHEPRIMHTNKRIG